MNWHIAALALSLVLEVVSLIPYLIDIVRGKTRPNKVSFSLWTLCQVIAFIAQLDAGPSWTAVVMGVTVLSLTIITILAFVGYGYREQGALDAVSLVLAVAAIVAWQKTGDPVIAIGFAMVADVFATIPTLVKTRRDPWSEHAGAWGLIALAYFIGLFSTEKIDAANLAMPIYVTMMNTTIFLLAYIGQRARKS